jgi:predicted Zn-dependent protease
VSPDQLLELAERALDHAHGEALVTAVHERSLLSRFARSRPTQATEVDELSVEVTSVREGRVATAAAAGIGDEELREAAARARAAAEAAARAGAGSYPGLPAPGDAYRPHDGWDPETAQLDPARAGAALGEAFAVAEAGGLEAFGTWTAGAVRTAVVSSRGGHGVDSVTDAFAKVVCRASDGASGFASAAGSRVDDLDMRAVAERARAKLRPGEPPAELPPGEYAAVLDAEAVGPLLEFLAAMAFDGLAHAEGRGALSGRLGDRVAAAAINLSDSPRFRSTLPRAFDAEGVPKGPLPLIQDGVAHAVAHDTRSAALAGNGTVSTGHALAPGGGPGPQPTNLILVGGGAAGVDELAAPIERGIYVTRLWYVNAVHPKHTLVTGMTRDGTFLIEDGRITRPLRDVRVTDSVLRLLDCTQDLGSRPRLVCEGEFYGRRFATGAVCPPVRVRGLRVTGATVA